MTPGGGSRALQQGAHRPMSGRGAFAPVRARAASTTSIIRYGVHGRDTITLARCSMEAQEKERDAHARSACTMRKQW